MTGASQHPSPHVPIERLDGNADLVVQGPLVLREDLEILQLLTGAVGIEPLTRARCDAYRLHEPTSLAGVPEACAAAATTGRSYRTHGCGPACASLRWTWIRR